MTFRKILISFAVVLVPVVASAQSGEALGFTRINQDVSRAGLAGAGSVSASSAVWASYENPTAALAADGKVLAGLGLNLWAPSGTQYYSAAASSKLTDDLSLTAGFTFGNGKAYDIYSSSGQKTGTFTPSEYLVNVGAAYRVLDFLSVGANAHYAGQSLAEGQSYGAFSADVFAGVDFGKLKAVAGVASLGSKVKSVSGAEYPLPTSAKAAVGYEGSSLGILSYGAYADADYYIYSGGFGLSVGATVGYSDLFALRAGYHYATDKAVIPSYASVGLGASVMGISIDLACLLGGPLSGTFQLGVGYRF